MIMLSIIGGGALAVLLLIMFFVGYFKAPTNKCFVISGLRKHARTVIGERYASLKAGIFSKQSPVA